MAEYYAVLKKAVGGLAVDSSDARRAVYEKARNALIGQLKAINPPLTTSEISRQRLELEEAIRRVEREAGADYSAAAPAAGEIYDEVPEDPDIDFDLDLEEAEPAPRGRRNREHQEAFHQAVQVAERQTPAPRAERREAPPPSPPKGRARNEPSFDVRAENRSGGRGGRNNDYAPDVRANSGGADIVPPEDRMRPSNGRSAKRRGRDEREAYSEAAPARGSRLPGIIMTVVVLGVLAGLGAVAWANRDFVGEVVGSFQGGSEAAPTPASTESASESAPADDTVRDVGGGAGISAPAPNQEIARTEPGAVPALPGGQQTAKLYEESRAQQGEVVATLNGGVTWRYIPSTPNGPVVEATISVPERGLSLVMTIRKNLDSEMPASHLVEITAAGTQLPGGGIDAIPRLVLKPAEEQKGTPLAGTPTKVVDGLYWIALAGGDAETSANVSIMRSSNWFDLPLLYKSGQRAILTFEKGAGGQEAFDKALAAWGN
jgi:hypothetical protein